MFPLKIFVNFLSISLALAANYCDVNLCPRGAVHIGCSNQNGVFLPNCPPDRTLVSLSSNDIQLILDVHNALRSKIAGGSESGFRSATKMATLKWNQELAYLAELNVKQCQMVHDPCRNTVQFRFVGQNLGFRARSSNFEGISDFLSNVINAWYNEVKDAKQSEINSCCGSNFSKVGHFLQVVQDRAGYVGCGVARYTNGMWRTLLLACNYSFGNVLGQSVYQSGGTASACESTGRNPRFPALCN